jgi:hypothetical protein
MVGVGCAATDMVVTPVNNTVMRRVTTQIETILCARIGCLGKTFFDAKRSLTKNVLQNYIKASDTRDRKNGAAMFKWQKNG